MVVKICRNIHFICLHFGWYYKCMLKEPDDVDTFVVYYMNPYI